MLSLRLRRVGRWCFNMCIIKILLDILNRFTKKCNTLYLNYDKNQNKKQQERLDALKVLGNKDYIMKNVSSKTKQSIYFVKAIVAAVIMLLLFFMSIFLNVSNNLLLVIPFILILFFSLFYTFDSIVMFLFSFNRYLRKILFSILISTNTIILGDIVIRSISDDNNSNRLISFFINSFKEYDLHQNLKFPIFIFWLIFLLISVCSCISLFLLLKTQDIFEIEAMETENRLILWILAIVTFIIGIDVDKIRLVGILCLILVIQTAIFGLYHSYILSKNYKKAQDIFQEQLLLEKPRYKELKKCYYHGGEKYKEKLLSTEKFLRLIKRREKYFIRRDKNNRYSYKSGFNPRNNISPTRNYLP